MTLKSFRSRLGAAIQLTLFIGFSIFVPAACQAEQPSPSKPESKPLATPSSPPSTKKIGQDEVTWVLDGTDLLDLADIPLATGPAEQSWAGHYRAEQGGSIIEFSLSVSNQTEQWLATRVYQEPGRPDFKKEYTLTLHQGNLLGTESNIEVKRSNEGVIVLERDSGLDSIPSGYWIHYLK